MAVEDDKWKISVSWKENSFCKKNIQTLLKTKFLSIQQLLLIVLEFNVLSMNHASKVWSRSKKQINHEILPTTTYGVVFIKKKPPNKQEWICHRDRKIRFNCINGTYFVILSSINGFHHFFFRPPEWKQEKKCKSIKTLRRILSAEWQILTIVCIWSVCFNWVLFLIVPWRLLDSFNTCEAGLCQS